MYELRINGSKVGEYVFTPGWTSYNKRLQYQTFDISNILHEGENAIGLILGNGWYKGYLTWADKNYEKYGKRSAVFLQIHVYYEDGTEEIIITDESWKNKTGPILMSEIYHGETYDARLELTGWDQAGFDDKNWNSSFTLPINKDILVPQEVFL